MQRILFLEIRAYSMWVSLTNAHWCIDCRQVYLNLCCISMVHLSTLLTLSNFWSLFFIFRLIVSTCTSTYLIESMSSKWNEIFVVQGFIISMQLRMRFNPRNQDHCLEKSYVKSGSYSKKYICPSFSLFLLIYLIINTMYINVCLYTRTCTSSGHMYPDKWGHCTVYFSLSKELF